MVMFRMPIFVWNQLVTMFLILLAFPVLTAAFALLWIDRHLGGHFYDPTQGGQPILWQNLFWFFGHPEVYILALPYFGIVTEVLATMSKKPVFGYKGMIGATLSIGALSMGVWAHHMYTTGAVLLPFFAALSLLIAVPTGIKFFNWIGTMWRGTITLNTAVLFCLGFLTMFLFGGITGRDPGPAGARLPAAQHLLHRRPLPLRDVRRVGLRGLRRHLLLVSQDHGAHAEREAGQAQLPGHVHRLQPDASSPSTTSACGVCPGGSRPTAASMGWNFLNMLSSIGAYIPASGC